MDTATLSALVTMNTELIKDMPTEEVLKFHPIIGTDQLIWKQAQKTAPIKVKPVSSILADDSVLSKVVVATLEGHETVKANAFVCWGIDNDLWQQTEEKLHAKYVPIHTDPDGWVHYEPKPDLPVNAAQVLAEEHKLGPAQGFSIVHPGWGDERAINGQQCYLQYGIANDYILESIKEEGGEMVPDHNDRYRVALKFFKNTYQFV